MSFERDIIARILSEISKSDANLEENKTDDAAWAAVPTKPEQEVGEISPEDAAWVDSCLVADPELSEESWNAFREALFETLTAQDQDDEMQDDSDEVVKIYEESKTHPIILDDEKLLLNLQEEDGGSNSGDSMDSKEDVDSPENIFRVWDLETLDEEHELMTQLKKALVESRLKIIPSSLDDRGTTLDELVMNMTDLSLKPSSD